MFRQRGKVAVFSTLQFWCSCSTALDSITSSPVATMQSPGPSVGVKALPVVLVLHALSRYCFPSPNSYHNLKSTAPRSRRKRNQRLQLLHTHHGHSSLYRLHRRGLRSSDQRQLPRRAHLNKYLNSHLASRCLKASRRICSLHFHNNSRVPSLVLSDRHRLRNSRL